MFDFLKPLTEMFKGSGTPAAGDGKKTTPPDPKAKPEEKKGANGLGGLVSGLFKGLFDDLGSMGEDPTPDGDLASSVDKQPPTKQEVEKTPPEQSKAVDAKDLVAPEEVAADPSKLLQPVVKDAASLTQPMLDPAAGDKTEAEKARDAFEATTPAQQKVLEQADALAGKDVVGVAEARRLAAMAKEAGVPAELLPKASTPEEILRAKGMTDDEIELYKNTLNKNQQSTLAPGAKDAYETKTGKTIEDSASKDASGEERKKASDEEIQAALKANIILFDQMQPGLPLTKIIPEGQVGGFLVGEMVDKEGKTRKMTKMAGDIGNSANTEGMTAEEKVGYLGLDYDEKSYVERKADGTVEVKEEVKKRLYQVEQAATEEQVENAQVPMGHDMYMAALAEAKRLQKEGKPLPRLLELDENGQLLHVVERNRHHDKDPSAGFGYTASMILRKPEGEEDEGEQYFQPNQEMNAGAQSFSKGAELTCVDDKGERKVLARFDGTRFVPAADLDEEEALRVQAMMDKQTAANATNTANAAARKAVA
jgi:hypothetical protein